MTHEEQYRRRQGSGAKAIALNLEEIQARYRQWLFLGVLFAAACALIIRILFGI